MKNKQLLPFFVEHDYPWESRRAANHRWIYFAYPLSTHEIDIIPELPPFLILPAFMIATQLAVAIYKKKNRVNSNQPDSN